MVIEVAEQERPELVTVVCNMIFLQIKNAASVPKAFDGFPGPHGLPDTHGKIDLRK